MSSLPNLTWLRTFEAAARLLNFTEAGRELGLTQTAVSLHIRSLEQHLGSALFLRQPRRLALTELGRAYALSVRKALDDMALSTTGLFGTAEQQTLIVRAPISTVTLWLAPLLPEFLADHPGINIRLISRIWTEPQAGEEVDVDLRLGHGDWPGVSAEKISEESIVPIVAAGNDPLPGGLSALADADLIHILGYEDSWLRYFRTHGIRQETINSRYFVDTSAAACELVAAGAGVAAVGARYARSLMRRYGNIAIAGPSIPFLQSHYLVTPPAQTAKRPETVLFEQWLKVQFTEY